MKSIFSFIKTTLIGGLFFIVPLFLVVVIFGKVINILRQVVAPIVEFIPDDFVGGITLSRIISLVVLIVICFFGGLISKGKIATQLRVWAEENILSMIPGYTLIKGMTETAAGKETENLKEVVLVDIEEVWQLGFLMEVIDDDLAVVYIPGAPNPASGDVVFVKRDRLKILDIPGLSALKISKKLGLNAKAILDGKVHSNIFKEKQKNEFNHK